MYRKIASRYEQTFTIRMNKQNGILSNKADEDIEADEKVKMEHQKMGLPFERHNSTEETYHFENEHYDDNELQDQYDHNHLGNYPNIIGLLRDIHLLVWVYKCINVDKSIYLCVCISIYVNK